VYDVYNKKPNNCNVGPTHTRTTCVHRELAAAEKRRKKNKLMQKNREKQNHDTIILTIALHFHTQYVSPTNTPVVS